MKVDLINFDDLSEIKKLQPQGWPDISLDFIKYMIYEFCEPVKVTLDDRIVGIGNAIFFKSSAWIAHIIVNPDFRNRGIGIQIVNFLLDLISAKGIKSVSLIATELGEPVYLKAGFRLVSKYISLTRELVWPKTQISSCIKRYTSNYYEQLVELDNQITGDLRENLIKLHLDHCLLYTDKDIIKGYYLPFLGEGPIYAIEESAGLELMKLKFATADKANIPMENKVGIDFLKKNGFIEHPIKKKRMVWGKTIHWQPHCIYNRIGGNYG